MKKIIFISVVGLCNILQLSAERIGGPSELVCKWINGCNDPQSCCRVWTGGSCSDYVPKDGAGNPIPECPKDGSGNYGNPPNPNNSNCHTCYTVPQSYRVAGLSEFDILYEESNYYRAVKTNCTYTLMNFSDYFNNETNVTSWHVINGNNITVYAGVRQDSYPFYVDSTLVYETHSLEDLESACSSFPVFLKTIYQQNLNASKIIINPNPANRETISIQFETPYTYIQNETNKTLKIYDLNGKVHYQKTGKLQEKNLLDDKVALGAATYIVEIEFRGERIRTKFIIE
jgi:hypothetical protein